MNEIFYQIVKLFRQICQYTHLTYEELNILVYCFLIPLSWLLILTVRTYKYWNWLIINLLFTFLFLFFRQNFTSLSRIFYHQNILFLEWLGANELQGYIYISLLIGLFIPFLMYWALVKINQKYLPYLVFSYFLGLSVYFLIVFWQIFT